MNKALALLMFIYLTAGIQAQTVYYVNASATGSNNGSSWANAFTTIQRALTASFTGDEIWVAKGVYKPSQKDSSFILVSGVTLLGGFDGTETNKNQRNPQTNVTILSGDLAGDDDLADPKINRFDNALHVIQVPADVIGAALDGFTISGGNTEGQTGLNDNRRGGGILAYGTIDINNCIFRHNYGYFGGAFYPRGTNSGFNLTNCRFSGNIGDLGGAMYILTPRGGTIDNCRFEFNKSTLSGSAVYMQQSPVSLTNSMFSDNEMTGNTNAGGAVYITESTAILENVDFLGNIVSGTSGIRGGALFVVSSNAEIKGCNFTNNRATNSGGAVHVAGVGATTKFSDCMFTGNSAAFGGAITNYNSSTNPSTYLKVEYDRCVFEGNTAGTSGGALSNGFRTNCRITNSIFDGNTARFGGACFAQNDTTEVYFSDCEFNSNQATSSGGAMSTNAGIRTTILKSVFEGNTANIGGALNISEDTLDRALLTLSQSRFNFNSATMQGGAVNMQNADGLITNNLFINNFIIEGTGAGGAFSINCVNGDNTNVKMVNNTLALNEGPVGSGISLFNDDMTPTKVQLLNNILHHPGNNSLDVEAGNPEFESLGGNLALDNSTALSQSSDQKGKDALFVDTGSDNYQLTSGSPCINKGLASPDAPKVDLLGKNRDAIPDVGAYEFQGPINTRDESAASLWSVWASESAGMLILTMQSGFTGEFTARVTDAEGRTLQTQRLNKSSEKQRFEWQMPEICNGVYYMTIQSEGYSSSKPFIF